jgi:hypothetical protein
MTSDDPRRSHLARVRDGRLEQIREHVDRVEHELNEIMELVAHMQADEPAPAALDLRGMQRPDERSATSACWPVPLLQEDSASLSNDAPTGSASSRSAQPASIVTDQGRGSQSMSAYIEL